VRPVSETEQEAGPACVACGGGLTTLVLADAEDYEYRVPGRFRFVRCEACGLVFVSPRPSRAALLGYYPADYHAYQRPTSRLFAALDRLNLRRRVRGYLRRLGGGRRVLDVGCGDGALLEEFRRRGAAVLAGVDFSPEVAPGAGTFDFFRGTLEEAPWPDGSFDLIVMHHVLEHVEEPLATLRRAHALLAAGGALVGQVPNVESTEHALFGRYWNGFHTPRHLQCFGPGPLLSLLRRAGFAAAGWRPAPHPGQWALSLQSLAVARLFPGARLVNGKARFYPLCLALALPLASLDLLTRRPGVIDFWART
jgi:SAM-dependent methyltransferase